MKAAARRGPGDPFNYQLAIRGHHLTADEPPGNGGQDRGPDPQELLAGSLAACTAITVEMYARRKGWDVGELQVECEFDPPAPGEPTGFDLTLRLPDHLSPEQRDRLEVIAAKCPVHRVLEGPVRFSQRVASLPDV